MPNEPPKKQITHPAVEDYMLDLTGEDNAVLADMHAYASEHDFPIIGPLVGRLLCQLAMLKKPRRIFELGSGFGYSAYWFSRGCDPGCEIICTDMSRENRDRAETMFKEAGIVQTIQFEVGDALQFLDQQPDDQFDIILNDIDKHDYPRALETAVPKLRKGGIFITDNVLWSGRVTEEEVDPTTAAVKEFNSRLSADSRLLSTIVPLRDGLAIALKL